MRLLTNTKLEWMSRQELSSVLNLAQVANDANKDDTTLRELLKSLELVLEEYGMITPLC